MQQQWSAPHILILLWTSRQLLQLVKTAVRWQQNKLNLIYPGAMGDTHYSQEAVHYSQLGCYMQNLSSKPLRNLGLLSCMCLGIMGSDRCLSWQVGLKRPETGSCLLKASHSGRYSPLEFELPVWSCVRPLPVMSRIASCCTCSLLTWLGRGPLRQPHIKLRVQSLSKRMYVIHSQCNCLHLESNVHGLLQCIL